MSRFIYPYETPSVFCSKGVTRNHESLALVGSAYTDIIKKKQMEICMTKKYFGLLLVICYLLDYRKGTIGS